MTDRRIIDVLLKLAQQQLANRAALHEAMRCQGNCNGDIIALDAQHLEQERDTLAAIVGAVR